jgi:hypothetical protein
VVHKTLQNKIDNYIFWNERIIGLHIGLKLQRAYLPAIGVYASTEGDEESSEMFYNLLQEINTKVNK